MRCCNGYSSAAHEATRLAPRRLRAAGRRHRVAARPRRLVASGAADAGMPEMLAVAALAVVASPGGAIRYSPAAIAPVCCPSRTFRKRRRRASLAALDPVLVLAIAAVAVVLLFDYTNGFHDAANIIAGAIASRAMTPVQAVLVVAAFEFLGPLLGGPRSPTPSAPLSCSTTCHACRRWPSYSGGLLGAIAWNLVTWWRGVPSSSSHALVGGLAGAVTVAVGPDHVAWGFAALADGHVTGVTKVLAALVLSPLIGFWFGFAVHRAMMLMLRGARPGMNRNLRMANGSPPPELGFSHGANDAQKSMGILALVLDAGRLHRKFEVPLWAMLSCAIAITFGILSGGWRIVRTLGFGSTRCGRCMRSTRSSPRPR